MAQSTAFWTRSFWKQKVLNVWSLASPSVGIWLQKYKSRGAIPSIRESIFSIHCIRKRTGLLFRAGTQVLLWLFSIWYLSRKYKRQSETKTTRIYRDGRKPNLVKCKNKFAYHYFKNRTAVMFRTNMKKINVTRNWPCSSVGHDVLEI